MIRKLDRMWFWLLGALHCWTVRQAGAHCRREKQRRFNRLLRSSNSWKN